MREVDAEAIEILMDIKKELQAIRSYLESKEVSTNTVVSAIKNQLREAIDQPMFPEDIKTYREIADQKITEEFHQ